MKKWNTDKCKEWVDSHSELVVGSKEELENLAQNAGAILKLIDKPSKLIFVENLANACKRFDYDDKELIKILQGESMDKNEMKEVVTEALGGNEALKVEIATLKNTIADKDKSLVEKDAKIDSLNAELNTAKASIDEQKTLVEAAKNTIAQMESDKTALVSAKELVDKEIKDIKDAQKLIDRKEVLAQASVDFDKLEDTQKKLVTESSDEVFNGFISLLPKATEKKNKLVDASKKNDVINDTEDKDEKLDYSFVRQGLRIGRK